MIGHKYPEILNKLAERLLSRANKLRFGKYLMYGDSMVLKLCLAK
jgi:hypothetical protein